MKLWRDFLQRRRLERELQDEIKSHIEIETRLRIDRGVPPQQALTEAMREVRSIAMVEEATRDEWAWTSFDRFMQDIRYALRSFRRSPTFVLAVIGTIGLGLGLNTAVFTVFNAYVLRPFPVRDSSSLYEVSTISNTWAGFSWDEYLQFPRGHPFSEIFGYTFIQGRMDGRDIRGQFVTGNYFQMLNVNPYLGRTLTAADSGTRNEGAVAVLSYEIWRSRYGGDPDFIGKDVTVNGRPLQVVGIAMPGFHGVGQTLVDLWMPITMEPLILNGPDLFGPNQPRYVRVVGRLIPGLDAAAARRDITVWAQGMPRTTTNPAIAAITMIQRATFVSFDHEMLEVLTPVVAAFFLVLLIACANVANLLLSRSLSRQREIGIRLSLGADRPRLIRQLLTESVLLAFPAALVGMVVSIAAIRMGVHWLAVSMPPAYADAFTLMPLTLDLRVFSAMILAAVLSAIVFGLFPAIQATNANIIQTARGDFNTDYRPSRLRNVLVAIQVTVSIVLLICAGVLLRGAQSLWRIDPGMNLSNVLVLEIQNRSRPAFLSYLRSNPAIETVGGANAVPMMGGGLPVVWATTVDTRKAVTTSFINVSAEYFDIFKMPVSRGRNITVDEAFGKADVAILSSTAAAAFWPEVDPIGRHLRVPRLRGSDSYRDLQIVGIVPDVIAAFVGGPAATGHRLIYTPSAADSDGNKLILSVRGDQESVRRAIDGELARIDPGGVLSVQPIKEVFATLFFPFTVMYSIALTVGVLALLLTISGVYGVVSFLVSQRTKEIGIRMALGATSFRVEYLVMKQLGRPVGYGALLGAVLAVAGSTLLASRVAVMKTFDLVGYGGAIVVVLFACGFAAFYPARRAARVNPASTLRNE